MDINGMSLRLNKAAGSAMKFFSKSLAATVGTWLLLGVLTYFVGVDYGYFQPPPIELHLPPGVKKTLSPLRVRGAGSVSDRSGQTPVAHAPGSPSR